MVGDLRDHRDLGSRARQDRRIDPLHVAGDEFDEPVDQGGLMTFERNDDGQQKVSHCHPAYIEMHAVSGKSKWYHPGIRRPNVGTSCPPTR